MDQQTQCGIDSTTAYTASLRGALRAGPMPSIEYSRNARSASVAIAIRSMIKGAVPSAIPVDCRRAGVVLQDQRLFGQNAKADGRKSTASGGDPRGSPVQ